MNPEKLLDALTPIEINELVAALQRRRLVSGAAAADGTVLETPAATAEDFLAQLSPETRARAETAQAAMVEKFGLRVTDVSIAKWPREATTWAACGFAPQR